MHTGCINIRLISPFDLTFFLADLAADALAAASFLSLASLALSRAINALQCETFALFAAQMTTYRSS